MRCLYCGKELALLKRWTGGGEFCSDAHRQQYQEEYNKLALNRLLQAQSPGEAKPAPKRETKAAEPEIRAAARIEPLKAEQPKAAPKPDIRPEPKPKAPEPIMARVETPEQVNTVAIEEPPEEVTPHPEDVGEGPEDRGPAESGEFFIELPVPVTAQTALAGAAEYDFARAFPPVIPSRSWWAQNGELAAAGQVMLAPSGRVLDYTAAPAERKLEVREFVRSAPMAEFELRPAGETGLLETSEEPMDILIFPHPPQGSPPLWQEAEQQFKFETQLGELGLVAFSTTGIDENAAEAVVKRSVAEDPAPAAPAASSSAPAPVVEKREAPAASPEPAFSTEKPAPERKPRLAPIVPPLATTKIERTSRPVFVRPPAPPQPAPAQSAPQKKSDKKEELAPAAATKPLPLTLHGLAAGRGKPVQVFASAVSAGVDVEIPRSSAVPMRPVMVVGAIPKPEEKKIEEKKSAERTVVVKSDPKHQQQQQQQPQPGRPDPRFANGKGRKPDVRITEPEEKKVEKVAAAAAAKDPVRQAPAEKRPEQKPFEQKQAAAAVKEAQQEAKPEPKVEAMPESKEIVREVEKPAPFSAPYRTSDLGLPNLSLESSGGFWSKLPLPAKVGAAAVVILGITLTIVLGGKGKSAAAGSGVVVEAGTPLPVIDSGWITDWGAEPGVRKVHEISVLRPSLTLSDYRIEFQAQIESKALGWVYRAQDGKNYYVNRLEIVKPGLDPTIALVRFAVINGEEQPRAQFPLSLAVHVDTLYKIRFDAVGDRFTTYVMDQKVDEWTDSRIKLGGVGLYNERGERMSLKGGVNVIPLAIRK